MMIGAFYGPMNIGGIEFMPSDNYTYILTFIMLLRLQVVPPKAEL